jgi:hypothetical protein
MLASARWQKKCTSWPASSSACATLCAWRSTPPTSLARGWVSAMRTARLPARVARARAQIDQRRGERRARRERVVDVQLAVAPAPALEPVLDPAPHVAHELAPALAQPRLRSK